jgi:UDP-N-acetyl-D-galactosamine dehydrogenase
MKKVSSPKIAIIGLGYVGLPLAVEFSKFFEVVGFDLKLKRINDLKKKIDETKEISSKILENIKNKIIFTNNINLIKNCNIFIITVPTPINFNKKPDLSALIFATKIVSKVLKKHDVVVYESTVFPGCTEEICVPILEKFSKLRLNKDFYCGYSPERINPGDKFRNIRQINKLVSGSNYQALNKIYYLYKKIIKADVIKVKTIKIAEGAKIIENTQRDLNIALINEFLIIFQKLNINFSEVLKAASTKWNFLNFEPGLVGGHCIGVDPYYLAEKSRQIGYNTKLILAGRKLNDGMSKFYFNIFLKEFKKKFTTIKNKNILVMGLSFKENVPDIRNSKSFDIIRYLKKKKFNVFCYDNNVDKKSLKDAYKINAINKIRKNYYHGIIIIVKHSSFNFIKKKIATFLKKNGVILDIKNFLGKNKIII